MATETSERGPCPVCGHEAASHGTSETYRPAWSDVAFCSRECARADFLALAIAVAVDRHSEGRNPN